MSADESAALERKIDGLVERVSALEGLVAALMARTLRYEGIVQKVKAAGLVLLGVAIGTGLVQINQIVHLFGG